MGDKNKNKNNKALWEKVNSITNWETRHKFSSKPFKPGFLDMVLSEDSEHATQFYSEEELTQIKKLKSQLGLGGGTSKTTEKNQNQRVIRESDQEIMHSHSQVEATKAEKKILSEQAPHFCWKKRLSHKFYCEKELAQINKLHSETTENTQTQRKRRRISNQEMLLDDDEEDEAVLAKPAKKKSRKMIASENVQELPEETRNRIAELNGTNTQFLMSKKLYNTDVSANNNRLSMPENSIKCEFLTEAEKECTREQLGMDVTVLDPCLREHSLVLKKWKMNSVFVYNLIKNWNKVVSVNDFQKDHELQIWSFRVNTKLYFVLNRIHSHSDKANLIAAKTDNNNVVNVKTKFLLTRREITPCQKIWSGRCFNIAAAMAAPNGDDDMFCHSSSAGEHSDDVYLSDGSVFRSWPLSCKRIRKPRLSGRRHRRLGNSEVDSLMLEAAETLMLLANGGDLCGDQAEFSEEQGNSTKRRKRMMMQCMGLT